LCSADFRRLLSRCACFIGALADRSSGKPSHSHVFVRATLLCISAALQFGVQVCVITDAGELGIMALSPSAFWFGLLFSLWFPLRLRYPRSAAMAYSKRCAVILCFGRK
jgi:hypothetical protein